jgi:predicted RNA-binding protein Jag
LTKVRSSDKDFTNINDEKKLIVTGTHDEISRAKDLIREKTDESRDARNYGNVIYMSIPAAKVGLVIGKQGQTIHDLQTASGARVAVLPNSDPMAVERQLVISGDEDAIKRAKELVHDVMYGIGTTLKLAGKNSTSITIPDHTIGLLIGKKGEYLKQMQEMSKAEIFIESVPHGASSTMRNVHISGSPEAMLYAQELVMQKVAAALKREGKEDEFLYEIGSYDLVKPSEANRQPGMAMFDPSTYTAYYQQYYAALAASADPNSTEQQDQLSQMQQMWSNPEYLAYYQQYYAAMAANAGGQNGTETSNLSNVPPESSSNL